jgi:hypothetical protein
MSSVDTNAVIRQQRGMTMRNNWIMTPLETAIFIGAAVLLASEFCDARKGLIRSVGE